MSFKLHVLQPQRLPCETCGGKCCVLAPFRPSDLRAARIANGGSYPAGSKVMPGLPIKAEFGGGPSFVVVKEDGKTCAFLQEGRCSVYEARPRTCRDYGSVPGLPCQELFPEEAQAIARKNLSELRAALKEES